MNLLDLIHREAVPVPWSEGEKIPWNEPAFSQRMLLEHLTQAHDAASRRFETIDKHVAWIDHTVLGGTPASILDLGCGPGLYANRLARLGHTCLGIDFSPASVAYARACAAAEKLPCTFIEQDVRSADFCSGYDLAMFIYGELNVFRPTDTRAILHKAHQALVEGGQLLLEVHTFAAVHALGEKSPSWYSSESGLFSERPHLCLMEGFWDAPTNAATERYLILDAQTACVTRYASTTQAFTVEQYQALLEESGFKQITFHPSLHGAADEAQRDFVVIVCRK